MQNSVMWTRINGNGSDLDKKYIKERFNLSQFLSRHLFFSYSLSLLFPTTLVSNIKFAHIFNVIRQKKENYYRSHYMVVVVHSCVGITGFYVESKQCLHFVNAMQQYNSGRSIVQQKMHQRRVCFCEESVRRI